MNVGLNVGIGSWIDTQKGGTGSPVFPAIAIPFELRHLSALETSEDLARAAELALLANRSSGSGSDYEVGGVPKYLWEQHRGNISNMIVALSTLTEEQKNQLQNADAVLYTPDGYAPSDAYVLYNETREIYQNLVAQGADAADVEHAYTNWTTLGHKSVIEEAIAVKLSLSQTTSRVVAQNDVSRIEMALSSLGGFAPYVPTTFTPISASSTEHWTEAEVDFQALEDAIRSEDARSRWKQFRAKRKGIVSFRFAAVNLIRPWFTTGIYEADDWRLDDSHEIVASGNGQSGTLPSYISHLYLAQVSEVRYQSPSKPKPQRPSLTLHSAGTSSVNMMARFPSRARDAGTQSTNSVRPLLSYGKLSVGTASSLKRGVRVTAHGGNKGNVPKLPTTIRPALVSRLESKPHFRLGSNGRFALIGRLNRVDIANRLSFVQSQLVSTGLDEADEQTSGDSASYIVGFGRTNLPRCPNPNPNYDWP